MGIPDHLTCLLRNLYSGEEATVRTGHGTTSWFKKLGKEYIKVVFCHPVYLTSMQSTSCEMPDGWTTCRNQDFQEKYQQPQIHRWYHSNGRGTKEPLDEGERES